MAQVAVRIFEQEAGALRSAVLDRSHERADPGEGELLGA